MKAVVLRKLRSAITVGLMLWCAGTGCMIMSYARAADMSGANAPSGSVGWGHASGSMGTHACCKARHKSERRIASSNPASSSESLLDFEDIAEVPSSSNAMNCCPLTSGTFVVTGRQRISDEDAPLSRGNDAVSVVTSVATSPLAIPLRLPNQNQTYLRGCVFLI